MLYVYVIQKDGRVTSMGGDIFSEKLITHTIRTNPFYLIHIVILLYVRKRKVWNYSVLVTDLLTK